MYKLIQVFGEKTYGIAENLHSPRRGAGQYDQFPDELGDDGVQHHGGLLM